MDYNPDKNVSNILNGDFNSANEITSKNDAERNDLMNRVRDLVRSISTSHFEKSDKINLINDIEVNINTIISNKKSVSEDERPDYKLVLGTKGSGAPERAKENYLETPENVKEQYVFLNKGTFGFIAQMATFKAVIERSEYDTPEERESLKRTLLNTMMQIDEAIADVLAYDAYEKRISIVRASNAAPEDILEKIKKAQKRGYETTICLYHTPLKECALNYNNWKTKNIESFINDPDLIESYTKTLRLLPILLNHYNQIPYNFTLVYNSQEQAAEHTPILVIKNDEVDNYLKVLLKSTKAEAGIEWDKKLLEKYKIQIDNFDQISKEYMHAFETLINQEHKTTFDPDIINKQKEYERAEKQKIIDELNKKHKKTGHMHRIIKNIESDDTSSSSSGETSGKAGSSDQDIPPIEPF